MKFLMYGHAGSKNHGCEAIVRSTVKILGDHSYYLQSNNWQEDLAFGIDRLVKPVFLNQKEVRRNSPTGLLLRVGARLSRTCDYDDLVSMHKYQKALLKNAVALSIGGDNYCYGGIIQEMREPLRVFQKKGIPAVLWGCSVGKELLYERTMHDLKSYALITARESETVDILRAAGVEENVVFCADPAFTLDRQEVTLETDFFDDGNVIGLNVSDFMQNYNAYPDATVLNFKNLIDYILKETDCKIAIIPHVRHEGNDDLIPSDLLAGMFETDRIYVVKDQLNCMQLKYLISQCKLFVGCRTHSTIAAYSTGVPTLVVGYSVKARGICKDLFGTTDDLLVDVRNFSGDRDLVRAFEAFREKAPALKEHLQSFLPEYISRAYLPKAAVEKLFS